MHQMLLIFPLLLACQYSVAGRKVITSVIVPPDGFKGDLPSFVEGMSCEFSCEGNEDKDVREMLWLWRDGGDCGVVCSIPNEPGPPPNVTESQTVSGISERLPTSF